MMVLDDTLVFTDGYIINQSGEVPNLKVGDTLEAVGLASKFSEGNRIRVRDTRELIGTKASGSDTSGRDTLPISKTYNLKNYTTNKLVINTPFSLVDLDETSVIRKGILVHTSATLKGTGLKNTIVTIQPTTNEAAIIDLSGVEVQEIQIENSKIKEIRGAENVKKWTISNGVDGSQVNVYHSSGEKITITR